MYKKKMFIYLALIFFIFIKNTLSYENSIIAKIEKEIITSIDVENESKYLLILNENLKKFNEKEIFEISKRSIVREKIKNIEIKKKFKNPNVPKDFIEQILKSIYQNIGIENLETFKKYLNENDIEYDYVKDKIEIETLWNELIVAKFSSEIKIDQDKIRQELTTNNNKYSKSFFVLKFSLKLQTLKKFKKFTAILKKLLEMMVLIKLF